jgi:N-methylhydantoinase B
LGLWRDLIVLDDERYHKLGVSVIWGRSKIPPYGISGGFSGAPQRVAIIRTDGMLEYVPVELGTRATLLPIHENEILSLRTGGGGGYGDPLERDP